MSLESSVRLAIDEQIPPEEDAPREKKSKPPDASKEIDTDKPLIKNIDDKDKFEWIELRTKYANKIYWLLLAEIVFLGVIVFLDGFNVWGFKINEWLLGSVFYGILTHTFLLVKTIVKNLFTR
nr:MAG TPA: hypothetical protein [Caudoviricetes sp.]